MQFTIWQLFLPVQIQWSVASNCFEGRMHACWIHWRQRILLLFNWTPAQRRFWPSTQRSTWSPTITIRAKHVRWATESAKLQWAQPKSTTSTWLALGLDGMLRSGRQNAIRLGIIASGCRRFRNPPFTCLPSQPFPFGHEFDDTVRIPEPMPRPQSRPGQTTGLIPQSNFVRNIFSNVRKRINVLIFCWHFCE